MKSKIKDEYDKAAGRQKLTEIWFVKKTLSKKKSPNKLNLQILNLKQIFKTGQTATNCVQKKLKFSSKTTKAALFAN